MSQLGSVGVKELFVLCTDLQSAELFFTITVVHMLCVCNRAASSVSDKTGHGAGLTLTSLKDF